MGRKREKEKEREREIAIMDVDILAWREIESPTGRDNNP